jgi:ectoine hydroxylase-related dioxygenase (phytanoyl-CoA dioxygenase family)
VPKAVGGLEMIEKNSAIIGRYDTREFPFKRIIDDLFKSRLGVASEDLHRLEDPRLFPTGIVTPGTDNNTPLHDILYTVFQGNEFLPVYRTFVQHLQAQFNEVLVFQKKPTFRIHLPGNLSVGNYHRDRDYAHPIEEINVWVPVTQATKTATIWMESEYEKNDFQPKELEVGEFLIFDSALKHGNEINREEYTRVSFDFRVIPKTLYSGSEQVTANRGHKLSLGYYYDQF